MGLGNGRPVYMDLYNALHFKNAVVTPVVINIIKKNNYMTTKVKKPGKGEIWPEKNDPDGPPVPVYCWIWVDKNPLNINERIDKFLTDGNTKPGFRIIQALQSQSSILYHDKDPDNTDIINNYMVTIFYTFL